MARPSASVSAAVGAAPSSTQTSEESVKCRVDDSSQHTTLCIVSRDAEDESPPPVSSFGPLLIDIIHSLC